MKSKFMIFCSVLLIISQSAGGEDLVLSAPADYQVYQRFSAKQGIIEIAGTFSAEEPAFIEARLFREGNGSQWGRVMATMTGKSFRAVFPSPAGGWYKLEVRGVKGKKITGQAAVEHVGIGEVFIVAGQSNSANHGEKKLKAITGVASAYNGKGWQPADDPQPGASGNMGSFMPPFADAMAQEFGVPVGIIACGLGGTSVREWLPEGSRFKIPPTVTERVIKTGDYEWESDGRAYNNLISLLRMVGPYGIRAVLWHQGESDANQPQARSLPGYLYWQYMERLVEGSRKDAGWQIPWFVAQATYHVPGDEFSLSIRAAQRALWESGLMLRGPDTDSLKGEMRENTGKGVHFSEKGLYAHAELWKARVAPWLENQLENQKYDKILPLKGEVFCVNGHVAFVILPGKISGTIPWVWYAPTLPGLPGREEAWMFGQFLKAGIAVAGIDVGESYGSPAGRKLFTYLYEELTYRWGFSLRPVMLGRSRGGLMTLNWIAENPEKTAGFAGIYPVCDISSWPELEIASGAYGVSAAKLADSLSLHNPVDRLAPMAEKKVPLFAIHGDADKLVPLERNSGEVKRRYDALGGNMELIIHKGQDHNMWEGFFKSRELVNFVIRIIKDDKREKN